MGHVNLIKLCVGANSLEDLQNWQDAHAASWPKGRAVHTTRMWPKREAELLGGGSLYWVIKGLVQARQKVLGLERIEAANGTPHCALLLDPEIIRTQLVPRRPFQGWRYLDPSESPPDARQTATREVALPAELARHLAEFGVL